MPREPKVSVLQEATNTASEILEKVGEVNTSFTLPNKKIKVIPVLRKNPLATNDRSTEAQSLYGTAHRKYTLPRRESGNFVNPFDSDEERNFIESRLGMQKDSLLVEKKTENFWINSFKPIVLDKNEKVLDLSQVDDYLVYKVLLTNKNEIAESQDFIKSKPYCRYAIVDLTYEDTKQAKKANTLADAYLEFAKIRNSREELSDIMYLLNNGSRVSLTASLEWLQTEVNKHITDNPEKFLTIIRDTQASVKVLLSKAVAHRIVIKENGVLRMPNNKILGTTVDAAIAFLIDPVNEDIRSVIEAQVRAVR